MLNPTPSTATKLQRGITLIESLIAIVIAALGILGILGVQMRTLTDTSTTVRRAQAIRLIEDLSERMKVNPNALANSSAYVTNFADIPSVGSCSSGCTPAQLASYDMAVWKKTVREALPLGQASIFIPPAESSLATGQPRQLGVMIAWRENEQAGHKTADIDATQVRGADGNLTAGASVTCPSGAICHLQYLPVAGRCAPYTPGGGTPMYFCPGA
jgi:type IV pilus assembly protein PilV